MTCPLLLLPDSDLAALIAGLRSRWLGPPFSASLVERLLGHSVSAQTVAALESFHQLGLTEDQLAAALELVLQDREHRPRLEDAVDLVTSGPEAPGIANRDTRVVVRELFAHAESTVLIAGYAVYQGRSVFEALAERMAAQPGLKVRLILDIHRAAGDTTLASLVVHRFSDHFRSTQWPQDRPLPDVYYDPRSLEINAAEKSAMHAKCIVVDGRDVFISSANFTEAAHNRNLEVGLLIRSPWLASNLTAHFDTLVAQRLLLPAWETR
jgi:hypothetical protein